MNESDAMRLLAEANPVRADAIGGMEMPSSLVASRRSSKRLVLAAAVALVAALAASLIGMFVFGQSTSSMEPGLSNGPQGLGDLGPGTPVQPPPPASIPVADISSMLGVPVALPTTAPVQPADPSSASAAAVCPAITADIDGTCVITVKFPSDSLSVEFWRPSGAPFLNQLAEAVRQEEAEAVRHPGSGEAELLNLNGVPARYLSGDYSIGPEGSGSIDFLVGPHMRVVVYGDKSEPQLEAAAQSILAGTPSRRQVSLAKASSVLGGPVVLPDTDAVRPADAAPAAETECVSAPSEAVPCQLTVEFPGLAKYNVPLAIRYLRPAQVDPSALYRNIAKQVKGAKVVSLSGVSALFVPGFAITYPSWIEFVADGTEVTIQGIDDEATLEAMAQSLLRRTPSE
jgi:hypothetical protein